MHNKPLKSVPATKSVASTGLANTRRLAERCAEHMASILLERITNMYGTSWVRAHGSGVEGFAFCSTDLHPDADGIDEAVGQITCPDCIAVIEACKAIEANDLAPEYQNDLHQRRIERDI